MGASKQKAICILGMHRSGTSPIARAINLMGAYIGRREQLLDPAHDNPEGFWEHQSIYLFHEKLLGFLSHSWDNFLPMPQEWWKRPEIEPYREELADLVQREFSEQPLWMWKDPRMSILLPLWKDVLREFEVDVYYIFCLRNPLDVAASLEKRDRFSKNKSLALWLYHYLSSLYWTQDSVRLILPYDKFLENWEGYLKKVSSVCGIPWPQNDETFRHQIETFLKPGLRHSHSDTESLLMNHDIPDPLLSVYRMLLEADENEKSLDSRESLEKASKLYSDYCLYANLLGSVNKTNISGISTPRENLNKTEESMADLNRHKSARLSDSRSLINLEAILRDKDTRIHHLETELKENVFQTESLERALNNKDTQIRAIESVIEHKDIHIGNIETTLIEKEAALNYIYNSYGLGGLWVCNKMIDKIFPQNSRRKLIARMILNAMRHPAIEVETFWRHFRTGLERKNNKQSDYELWIQSNEPTNRKLRKMRKESRDFKYRPKISIITPVWNTDGPFLCAAIDSILAQAYDKWEICLADGGSTKPHVKRILQNYAHKDKRIKVKYLDKNEGIAENSNEALTLATGDFIGLMDHDDELAPFALFEIVNLLNQNSEIDFIYSDEDKIDLRGERTQAFFKPSWSPDLLFTCGYTNQFSVYRRKVIEEIGGFRSDFNPSHDYDLVLRLTEQIDSKRIAHIPKILYHWRTAPGSSSIDPFAKNGEIIRSAKKALNEAMLRRDIKGIVLDGLWPTSYRIKRDILDSPRVSIIIPIEDEVTLLDRCIESINLNTTYENFELLIVYNHPTDPATVEPRAKLDIKILQLNGEFNFSKMVNIASTHAKGDYLVFLHSDTEVISPDWIQAMLEHAQREEVGAVGCKLLYPDRSIQHAGMILGMISHGTGGIAGHVFRNFPYEDPGYFGSIHSIRNYSAVSAAAMMVRKKIFDEVGGFEEKLPVFYRDIDFCLKIREKDYLIVYTPYAELFHKESAPGDLPADLKPALNETTYLLTKWGSVIKRDPYYSPNLSLESENCRLNI